MFSRLPSAGHLHIKAAPQPETTVSVQLVGSRSVTDCTTQSDGSLHIVSLQSFSGAERTESLPLPCSRYACPFREVIIISLKLRRMSESKV